MSTVQLFRGPLALGLVLVLLVGCQNVTPVEDVVSRAPVAAISSPLDEAVLTWSDYDNGSFTGLLIPVSGVAVDAEDGELAGTSLTWSWRIAGESEWNDGPTGASDEFFVSYAVIGDTASVEIRFRAEDSDEQIDEAIVTITAVGPPS